MLTRGLESVLVRYPVDGELLAFRGGEGVGSFLDGSGASPDLLLLAAGLNFGPIPALEAEAERAVRFGLLPGAHDWDRDGLHLGLLLLGCSGNDGQKNQEDKLCRN